MSEESEYVVSNAGPLIALAKVGHLSLLRRCYASVLVPHAVFSEISQARFAEASEIKSADFLVKCELERPVEPFLLAELGIGEAEAIALAIQRQAMRLLIDERKGRRIATIVYGVKVTGTAGILLRAKQRGFITAIRPALKQMRESGYFLSDRLIDGICQSAGE